MKSKTIAIIAILVLLIAAQIIFGNRKQPAERPAAQPETAGRRDTGRQAGAGVSEEWLPRQDDVTLVALSRPGEEPAVTLARSETGWNLAGAEEIPADGDKVERLIRDILVSPRAPLDEDSLPPEAVTGLEEGHGVIVAITDSEGRTHATYIGLRPEGRYDRTAARMPNGEEVFLEADIRGDLGLWRNLPDALPDESAWMERRVFRFDPGKAVRVRANYPDHEMGFRRDSDGIWEADGYIPGGSWNREGFASWLADLADLRVEALGEESERDFLFTARPGILTITVALADGEEKSIRIGPDTYEGGMLAAVSDRPGQVYRLPEWRIERHFLPLRQVFPDAVPEFDIDDIRFLDLRRGVESVKIARRDGIWRPIGVSFPLRQEKVELLVRLLSSLKPHDYATNDFRRAAYGAPMVEVTLAGDEVHQYRLAGRHPVFPWRYVVVGGETLSISDAEAAVIFPGTAEILDLGLVFPDYEEADVLEVVLDEGGGRRIIGFTQNSAGGWTADTGRKARNLTADESATVVRGLLDWNVAGFFDAERSAGDYPVEYRLKVADKSGREKTIDLLEPRERDIPYVSETARGYLVDRSNFSNWLADVREIAQQLDQAAEREEAEREAAMKAQQAREQAEREAELKQLQAREEAERKTALQEQQAREEAELKEQQAREAAEREAAQKAAAGELETYGSETPHSESIVADSAIQNSLPEEQVSPAEEEELNPLELSGPDDGGLEGAAVEFETAVIDLATEIDPSRQEVLVETDDEIIGFDEQTALITPNETDSEIMAEDTGNPYEVIITQTDEALADAEEFEDSDDESLEPEPVRLH